MKNLKVTFISIKFIFHYLLYRFYFRKIVKQDIEMWNQQIFKLKQYRLGFLLQYNKEFRSLFYYRYKDKKYWVRALTFLAPGVANFLIIVDQLGRYPMFYHPFSTIINCKRIGDNCVFRNNTTIGNKAENNDLLPIIGNNVNVGANVVIIGDITIGDNVTIGAGSVVVKNIPSNCIIAGNPARIIKYNYVNNCTLKID